MKGVIWKIEGRKSIVLFQNGDFRAISTPPDAQTGMSVTVSYNKKRLFLCAALAAAAALSAAALYFSPAGYIDIIYELQAGDQHHEQEENRLILVELSINRFDRIVDTLIFSADAAFTESLSSLAHKKIDEGYAHTVKSASLLPSLRRLRLQIAHKDMARADALKARFIHLTEELEIKTGRELPLNIETEPVH